ncbi:hypothetical protein [Cylindrospermopsis raciborskii]|uniref:Uncharacterized protein n=1 Tax=Cylindrospermopsis raciborskii CENA302 TaxID=1170768 RepID=A0A9Q5QY67_9CYAN|nr:hypothetical protein [Cylindrospermopsis raciborskii]OPH10352.1 hypothetical protein CENA302_05915 [Cylindrospermopsis raciborskii CENA302]
MDKILVVQVLGTSDVIISTPKGEQTGASFLAQEGGYDNESITLAFEKILPDDIKDGNATVNFPLIERLHHHLSQLYPLSQQHWLIVLTNQRQLLNHYQGQLDQAGWQQIVTTDGYRWSSFLECWFKERSIPYSPLFLEVDSSVKYGVADWDSMANFVVDGLNKYLNFQSPQRIFLSSSGNSIRVNQVLVQHSSGTPALSSALYLWGMEQRLAGYPLNFVYISVNEKFQEPLAFHDGSHWQWRLKKPQVINLLKIQDFNGAINLLGQDFPDPGVLTDLQGLERLSAFNLKHLHLSPKEDVIERMAVALWSQEVFRDSGQWANWYLRVAGALELAILCLVEQQGVDFQWKKSGPQTILSHPQCSNRGFTESIQKVVNELLSKGKFKTSVVTYEVNKVEDGRWEEFCEFYCPPPVCRGWIVSGEISYGFVYIRNSLYHSLFGDSLDDLLDEYSKKLGRSDHPEHPAFKAVGYLLYVLRLAGLKDTVLKRRERLQEEMKRVLTRLSSM